MPARSTDNRLVRAAFLILEDHELLAHALARALKPYGRSKVADTARQAARLLRRRAGWSALFFAEHLREGNGLDVLAYGRDLGCRAPALVLSSLSTDAAINRAYDLGAKYIVKPADPARVIAFAREATGPLLPANLTMWELVYGLTPAEALVLRKAADGFSRDRMTVELSISRQTLKTHVHRILSKTGDDSLWEATTRLWRERVTGQLGKT